jgi:thiosulfate oxidation carrier complex protein SoxZ
VERTSPPEFLPAARGTAAGWGSRRCSQVSPRARPRGDAEAIRKVVGRSRQHGPGALELHSLSENGNAVPLGVTVESPMTEADHVRAIHVFTEKNPQPDVVSFRLGPRAGRARVATRIRLADTQTVVAISESSDGSFWSASADVVVTLAACGGRVGMASALINVPPRARRGEIIEVKTLISHPMETGYRRSQLGALIPRDIIRLFVCTYNGTEVFRAELHPAIAANPFFAFSTVAAESGTIALHWTGDNGFSMTESAAITVE